MRKKGNWTVTNTKHIYKNDFIEVHEDQVIQPDGKPGSYGVVIQGPGVSVLAVDEKKNVYLIKEYRYAIENESIEVISGNMEDEETPEVAAKRELKEEGGIEAEKITYIGFVDPFTSVVASKNHMCIAQELSFTKRELEGTEDIRILKVPFKQAYDWAKNGTITHAASVVVILKAKEILNL